MRILTSLLALLALVLALPAQAQNHSGFPVHITVPKPPAPFMADGRVRLAYELHVTNYYPGAITLAGVDVLAENTSLASLRGAALQAQLVQIGSQTSPADSQVIEGGRTSVVFVDLTLEPGAALPQHLRHRLLFSVNLGEGQTIERAVEDIEVDLLPPALQIAAPLRGGRWVAGNGLFSAHHRRSFNAVDGRERLAQRFAIDWILLGPDSRFFRGDASENTSFAGYGAEVLAVADGTVAHIKADLPDNPGKNPIAERTITLDNITGNTIILDLGGGHFALYAHLQPGSLKVALGERVTGGQVLAKLGNSGNSDAPHLHFQLTDANSPLGAEGIPYAFTAFTQTGVMPDLSPLDTGKPWQPAKIEGVAHRGEFPADGAVVTFP